tara:strand:+ start:455 stop:772 length:318 start_codon:yes stop_codon:yes gene_type:complete
MKQLVEVQLKDIDLPDNAKQSGDNDWQISDQKRERLGRRFNHLVRHNDHWKEPFRAVIPALLYDEYAEAAAFFAGSPLEVLRKFKRHGVDHYEVQGPGYFICVGA